jgi:predicted amidohydrolase YtcJ
MSRFSRRKFLGASAVLPLGFGLSGSASAQDGSLSGAADMIVTGAKIITMDRYEPLAEAIAVRGSRILAIGTNEKIMHFANASTTRIDASGMTMTPGFIDAHSHPLMADTATGVSVDYRSIDEVKSALAKKASETPPGHWVRGYLYDDTKFSDERPLNRIDIDDAVTSHPVFVGHRGGHTAVVNSRAFEVAGVTIDTPDPEGGMIYREDGELTGKIAEHALDMFRSVGTWPVSDRRTRQDGARISLQSMAAAGLTSTTDALGSYDNLVAYQDARAAGELAVRISYMPYGGNNYTGDAVYQGLKMAGVRSGFGDDMIRIGAVKYWSDGSASERTMSMSTPYNGRPNDFGILTMSQDEIDMAVDDAVAHGFRIGIHANGDVAIERVMNAYERVLQNRRGENPRFRIEHCSLVNDTLLARIKAAGVVPTPFYTYAHFHGNKWGEYGEQKMENMFAHKSFLDAGIPVAPASDYLPGPFEPMMAIQSMVTRKDVRGRVWGPSQRISVTEAMRICTVHGAYASFEENSKGSLAAGKLADFVILENDPHEADPDTIKDIKVVRTVMGGRTTYSA